MTIKDKKTKKEKKPWGRKKKLVAAIVAVLCVAALATAAVVCFENRSRIKKAFYLLFDSVGGRGLRLEQADPGETATMLIWEFTKDGRVTVCESLMLINRDHPVEEGYLPAVSDYMGKGVLMNDCIQDAYRELAAAVSEKFDGSKLYVMSAYRTFEEQREEFLKDPSKANKPGTSEHQAGLALDVYFEGFAGEGILACDEGIWLNSHCWEYGFIIRYPQWGTASTGVPYEPWHIRYVGLPHSEIMTKQRLTLEQYIGALENNSFYRYGDYLIQTIGGRDEMEVPAGFDRAWISNVSADRDISYIITYHFGDGAEPGRSAE
jgi:D-alanyl-D-alanine carboxypeptidase